MISHKYKCIFIHIPRCAGTSIEKTLVGNDWWHINKATKHIPVATAKEIYKDYWDDYFKFSIIRNPWSRLVSMTRYAHFYKLFIKNDLLDISHYVRNFPNIEKDQRSSVAKDEDFDFSISNSLYQNILGSELDYIAKFENLDKELPYIYDKIKFTGESVRFECKTGKGGYDSLNYQKYYTAQVRDDVYNLYKSDIDYFNYKF